VAEKMGKKLGRGEILLGSVSRQCATQAQSYFLTSPFSFLAVLPACFDILYFLYTFRT